MSKERKTRSLMALAVGAGLLAAAPALAQPLAQAAGVQGAAAQGPRPPATIWGCDAPAGHACAFFVVSATAPPQRFIIPGGQKGQAQGIRAGADIYFVTVDVQPPSDVAGCLSIQKQGRFCKVAVVNEKYNN